MSIVVAHARPGTWHPSRMDLTTPSTPTRCGPPKSVPAVCVSSRRTAQIRPGCMAVCLVRVQRWFGPLGVVGLP